MTTVAKLKMIKIIHTIVWIFFNIVLGYLAYAAIAGKIDKWVWIGISLIVLEGIVLLIFGNRCPLTVMARKYSDSSADNFDIYLPNWLAKYNKLIYTSIFLIIIVAIFYRLMS
ncbi:MAG: hypothetical protein IPO83_16660 [Chitinophagaceae bacterium]|nr:hypothetical protein [Chitinophagaceae bacterium]